LSFVLDASVVTAVLLEEAGHEQGLDALETGVVSAVNVAETAAALLRRGMPAAQAVLALEAIAVRTIAADHPQAVEAGLLRQVTDAAGLSLGDRFCLALARKLGRPVLTADRAWLAVADAAGVEVRLLR
jgi:ribonuclease VapC